jgi:hypothetical protein
MDMRTGEYGDIRNAFQVTEDFWQRDWQQHNIAHVFSQGGYQIYTNGFTSGRVSYIILQQYMTQFFKQIWQNPTWSFRPPISLKEASLIVDLYIRTIGVLFQLSNYSAPFIGGTPIHRRYSSDLRDSQAASISVLFMLSLKSRD